MEFINNDDINANPFIEDNNLNPFLIDESYTSFVESVETYNIFTNDKLQTPDDNKKGPNNSDISKVEFKIESPSEELYLAASNDFFGPFLVYTKNGIDEPKYNISVELFNEFISKVKSITTGWHREYSGNIDDNKWSIKVIYNNEQDVSEGIGNYPDNWNELIELVIKYELLYKEKSAI